MRPAATLLFIVLSGIGLWLTWGSDISLPAAAVPLAFWDGEFAALLVPGTDPSPHPAKPSTFPLFGTHVHGNLLFPVGRPGHQRRTVPIGAMRAAPPAAPALAPL